MTVEEVRTLPLAQEFQIMAAIWEDLRDRFERAELPQRLKDLLDQRRARARDGSAKTLGWDSVRTGIGRA